MGDLRQTSPESGPGPRRARGEWHRITVEPLYVRAELFNRETLEETQKFLDDTVAAMAEHGGSRLLIYIVNAKPIFAVEKYGFSRYLDVALKAGYKIALVGSSRDLRIAHQYYAMLAQQRGVNLRAFPDEVDALAWLRSDEASPPSPERA